MMTKKTHDIVIIGGGIAGVCVAYFLARSGQDVCVVERNFVGGEGTGRCAGALRLNFRPIREIPMVQRSLELWKNFSEESDIDFQFRQNGQIWLLWNEKMAAEAQAMTELQRAAGLECYYLDKKETHALIPAFVEEYVAGLFSPTDASTDPYLGCLAISRLAMQQGAKIYERNNVTGIQVTGGRVSAVETDQGTISTSLVINTAGPWAPLVNKMVGYDMPAILCRAHLMVTEPLPKLIGPLVHCGEYSYFNQTPAGNLMIGVGSQPDGDFAHRKVAFETLTKAANRASTLIPRLRSCSTIRTFTGYTMWTLDRQSIVGAFNQPERYYIAAEFNATGYATGPVIGELVSELILTGKTSLPIDFYDPNRFLNDNDETMN